MGTHAHRESEKARTQRLTADGRLAAFHRRVTELKSGAANKVERQQAWRLAIEEFAEPEPDPNEELVDPEAFEGKPPSTRASAIKWVADNLALSGVGPADAPRPDAASLLAWVRRSQASQTVFWSRMYPLVLPTRQTMESDESRFEKNPLLEELFAEGRKKVLAMGARVYESWSARYSLSS